MKHALFCTTLELETAQLAAEEEKRRSQENENQLLQLLDAAFRERDEAKCRLQMLLKNIEQSNPTEFPHVFPNLPPESALVVPAKGNPSITESDTLSETYIRHSRLSSSPVDSIPDVVPSPELSNINVADSSNMAVPIQPFLHEHNKAVTYNGVSSGMTLQIDPAVAIIDRLAMKRPLPEKGRLLQAVVEARPLLQTLLVAGPLPEWRNPPPPRSSPLPPVSIGGCDSALFSQKPLGNSVCPAQSSSAPYHQTSNCAPRFCSTSMLNFSSPVSPCLRKRPVLSYGVGDDGIVNNSSPIGKRHKFQC